MKRHMVKRAFALVMAGVLTLGGVPGSPAAVHAEGGITAPVITLEAAPAIDAQPGEATVDGYIAADNNVTFTGQKDIVLTPETTKYPAVTYLDEGERRAFKGYWEMTQAGDTGADLFDIQHNTPFYVSFWAKLDEDAQNTNDNIAYSIIGRMDTQYGIQAKRNDGTGDYIQAYCCSNNSVGWQALAISEKTDLKKWTHVQVLYDGDKFWVSVENDKTAASWSDATTKTNGGIALGAGSGDKFTVGYNYSKDKTQSFPGYLSDIEMYRMEDTSSTDNKCENADAIPALIEKLKEKGAILKSEVSGRTPYTYETKWLADGEEMAEGEKFKIGKQYTLQTIFHARDGETFEESSKPSTISVGNEEKTVTAEIAEDKQTMTVSCEFDPMTEVVTDGLIGYYTFDEETSGESYANSAPEGENKLGAAVNNEQSVKLSEEGVRDGKSVVFDGAINTATTQHLEIADAYQANGTASFSFWMKPSTSLKGATQGFTGGVGVSVLHDLGTPAEKRFPILMYHPDDEKLGTRITGSNVYTENKTVELDKWYHVAVVSDAPNHKMYLYVNGKKLSEEGLTTQGDYADGKNTIWVGAHKTSNANYNGLIDDLRIYNTLLEDEDVTTIYNREKPTWEVSAAYTSDTVNGGALKITSGEAEVSSVEHMTEVTFTAADRTGYNFKGWYADAEATQALTDADTKTYTVNVQKPLALYAKYEEDTTIPKVVAEPAEDSSDRGTVTITVDGNEIQSGDGVESSGENKKTVVMTAIAKEGFRFVQWQTADGTMVTRDASMSVEIDSTSIAYYAHFKEAQADPLVNVARAGENSNVTLSRGTLGSNGDYPIERITDGNTSEYADFVNADTTDGGKPDAVVQIDLGKTYQNIDHMKLIRYSGDSRIYNGTVIVVSEDAEFAEENSTVIYNSDSANIHGFGAGTEAVYQENKNTVSGVREIAVPEGISARYVRIYVAGKVGGDATDAELAARSNHIREFEVYVSANAEALQAKFTEAQAKYEEVNGNSGYEQSQVPALKALIDDVNTKLTNNAKEDAAGENYLSEKEKQDLVAQLQSAMDAIKEASAVPQLCYVGGNEDGTLKTGAQELPEEAKTFYDGLGNLWIDVLYKYDGNAVPDSNIALFTLSDGGEEEGKEQYLTFWHTPSVGRVSYAASYLANGVVSNTAAGIFWTTNVSAEAGKWHKLTLGITSEDKMFYAVQDGVNLRDGGIPVSSFWDQLNAFFTHAWQTGKVQIGERAVNGTYVTMNQGGDILNFNDESIDGAMGYVKVKSAAEDGISENQQIDEEIEREYEALLAECDKKKAADYTKASWDAFAAALAANRVSETEEGEAATWTKSDWTMKNAIDEISVALENLREYKAVDKAVLNIGTELALREAGDVYDGTDPDSAEGNYIQVRVNPDGEEINPADMEISWSVAEGSTGLSTNAITGYPSKATLSVEPGAKGAVQATVTTRNGAGEEKSVTAKCDITVGYEIKAEYVSGSSEEMGSTKITAKDSDGKDLAEGSLLLPGDKAELTPQAEEFYLFKGWYKDEAGTDAYEAAAVDKYTYTVQENDPEAKNGVITFYAKFELDKENVVPIETITLTPAKDNLTEAGETTQVTAEIKPENASIKTLEWSTSDEKIATVDENGLVTAVASGEVTITAKAKDGSEVTGACKIKVEIKEEPGNRNPFADIDPEFWKEDREKLDAALKFVYDNKYMTGYSEKYPDGIHFGPADDLLRYQFALIVYRMAGSPEFSSEVGSKFEDVTLETVSLEAKTAILWAESAGIIKGYNETTFGPNDKITRAQMMTMMYRYAEKVEKLPMEESEYSDLSQFGDEVNEIQNEEMKKAISWCVGKEIVGGVTVEKKLKLLPQGTAVRAQCAIVVSGFAKVFDEAE